MSKIVNEVREALDRLPGTPDGIARYLEGRGITGIPVAPTRCPLAVYLRKETGAKVSVSPTGVSVHRFILFDPPVMLLPAAARAFVTMFDTDDYPALKRGVGDDFRDA